MTRDDDDPATFEPIRDTQHGKGSAKAANKGKVKRRLKYARSLQPRHGRKPK